MIKKYSALRKESYTLPEKREEIHLHKIEWERKILNFFYYSATLQTEYLYIPQYFLSPKSGTPNRGVLLRHLEFLSELMNPNWEHQQVSDFNSFLENHSGRVYLSREIINHRQILQTQEEITEQLNTKGFQGILFDILKEKGIYEDLIPDTLQKFSTSYWLLVIIEFLEDLHTEDDWLHKELPSERELANLDSAKAAEAYLTDFFIKNKEAEVILDNKEWRILLLKSEMAFEYYSSNTLGVYTTDTPFVSEGRSVLLHKRWQGSVIKEVEPFFYIKNDKFIYGGDEEIPLEDFLIENPELKTFFSKAGFDKK